MLDLLADEARLKNLDSYLGTPNCGHRATVKIRCWSLDIPRPITPQENIDNLIRALYRDEEEEKKKKEEEEEEEQKPVIEGSWF